MNILSSKMLRIAVIVILVACSVLSGAHRADARRPVRAGIFNFSPLLYTDANGHAQGFFVKMLDRIAEQENWDVQYVPGTWQENLDRLANKQVDLVLGMGYTADRAKFLDFPKEFLVLDWGVVYKPKASQINTIMDLQGKTVCGLKGSVYSEGFLELTRQFQIKVTFLEMDQLSDIFKAVESGQADAGVTSNIPGILNEDAHRVERTPIVFTPVKLSFAVNAGQNGDLIAALDRDITRMKADENSVYNHELGHLFGRKQDLVPKEVYLGMLVICGVLVASIVFIVVLRRKVRQKTAELDEQDNLMRSILNGTTDAVFIKDTQGRYIVVNDEVVRLFGKFRAEIIGHDDYSFFSAAEAEFLKSRDRTIMEGDQVVTKEEHITILDEPRVYLATKGPVYDKHGGTSGIFGISRDITGIKEAETELHRYSQLLKKTGEIALVGGWELDLATRKPFWSDLVRRILEVEPEVTIGIDDALGFYSPDGKAVLREAVRALIEAGTPFDLELPLVTAKQNHVWGRIQGEAEYAEGKVVKILGSLQDVTARKKMEEQLRQSNEQLGFVLEGSQLGFWDWNMETGEVARNERWAEMLGYTLNEVELSIDQWTNLIHPDDEALAWKSINDHLEGRTVLHEAEYRVMAKDGRYRWILDRARIVQRGPDGRPTRMSGTHSDITARKRAEEEKNSRDQQMQHAQRLESLGVLSGGIAHDFNNILAIIIGHCSLAKLGSHSAERSIDEIERAAERAAGLCRQMLAYAGKSQFVQERVNFAELVDDMVRMLQQTISRKVHIKVQLESGLPIISGDASQLRQIVMNLVINASEAIGGEQGEIRIALALAEFEEGRAPRDYLGRDIVPGSYLCLEVSDNGCGMDSETMIRLFEPFYTTKFTGRGLGMSAVLGIITSHQGALQLMSELGSGTTFRIYLPAETGAAAATDAEGVAPVAIPWQGTGMVLLVEDEAQVRLVARALLEKFGFGVLEAVNGKEALELYRGHAGTIRLVLTDMGMPVMDGHDLVRELHTLDAALPVVIASGFGDSEITSRLDRSEVAGMISKPYNTGQLRDVLRRVVEGVPAQ